MAALDTQQRYDMVVVGAGIVGLATARELLRRHPALRLAVIEKENDVARHQSSHNSGVIHSGIYYSPGSLRAQLCREGRLEMEAFAQAHDIAFRRCGKLIVAVAPRELAPLAALARRAVENGIEGVREIGPAEMREIEPAVQGLRALVVPATGVIDFHAVALALAREIENTGGQVLTGRRVLGITEGRGEVVVSTTAGDMTTTALVSCAGLYSDRLAAMTEDDDDVRILPVRGEYYSFSARAAAHVRALIYPVPDPAYPFLGVHLTRTIRDEVHAGPNAVLAFAREGYRRGDVSARDLAGLLAFPGFYRMAAAHIRTALHEGWRDLSRRAYAASLRRYIPAIEDRDLAPGPAGVRAQAINRRGRFLDDFDFGGTGRVLHVRNAPSPAATASLAIARHLADEAEQRFGLRTDR